MMQDEEKRERNLPKNAIDDKNKINLKFMSGRIRWSAEILFESVKVKLMRFLMVHVGSVFI